MPFVLLAILLQICNADWEDTYPECGFAHQSPINLEINGERTCEEPLTLGTTLEFNSTLAHFAIRNNGHSLQLIPFNIQHKGGSDLNELQILYHSNDSNIRLQNPFYNTFKSRINSEYCFDSVHFHWDNTNEYGSEHTINGKRYPLELHAVHYSCDYYVSRTALEDYVYPGEQGDDDNVLAVIGILFEIGETNLALEIILQDDIINDIAKKQRTIENNLIQLHYVELDIVDLLPKNRDMVAYTGSLTTQPCYETVRWMVMKNTVTVSQEQMDKLRMLLKSTNENDTIAPNWRPLQDIGDRTLYQCKEDIDALNVEKNPVIQKAPDGYVVDIWLSIGTIFIGLFVMSMIANVCLVLRYKNDNTEYSELDEKSVILTHSHKNNSCNNNNSQVTPYNE